MTEILQTNDDLIRVIDSYKKAMGIETPPPSTTAGATGGVVPPSSGEPTGGAPLADPGAGGADILIDLAGLNLGPPPSTSGQGEASGNLSDELLLAELGIFGGGR